MLEYEFEKVPAGQGVFIGKTTGHREIILRRAAKGWRYMGYVPIQQSSHGANLELDLIFEREQAEE